MSFDTISVIGLGYIGLPTAAAFASRKKKVVGVDVNQHAVDTINRGAIHIVEPDLDKVVKDAVDGGFPAGGDQTAGGRCVPDRGAYAVQGAITSRIWPMSKRRRNRWRRC